MYTVKLRRIKLWMKQNFMLVICTLLFVAGLIMLYDHFISRTLGHKDDFCDYHSNIFMIETSGSSRLRPRQACAVESAARHHPASKVNVIMFTEKPVEDAFSLKATMSNIAIKSTNFEAVFSDTPLWSWYRRGEWRNSTYKVYDLSDASRICFVWKHGGLYLDLDIISLRPICGIENFLIRQEENVIANSIFGFAKRHHFLAGCLQHFETNYKRDVWASSGPTLITNTHKSLCASPAAQNNKLECNVDVLPPRVAFPVLWTAWKEYFDQWKTRDVLILTRSSHMVHLWNFLSGKTLLSINSGTACEEIMKNNCPSVYEQLVRLSRLDKSFVF